MSSDYKGHRDFSDIDNLERATQSFMKETHRQLSGVKAVRAPRNRTEFQFKLIKFTKIGAIAAVILLIVGVAVFAGIKFGSRNAGLIKPEQSNSSAAETDAAETKTDETEAAKQTEDTAPPETTAEAAQNTKPTTTATTAPQTDEPAQSSSVTPASSATTSETVHQTSAVTTSAFSAGASSQHASTTAPHTTNAPAKTTAKTTTAKTTAKTTTAKTTTAAPVQTTSKAVTTKATPKTTTKATTTTSKATTVTTTTTAAKAIIVVDSVSVGGWESYNNGAGCSHILTVTVKNTGNATLSGLKDITITCIGGSSVIHAAVTDGSSSGAMRWSKEKIYIPYSGKLAPGESETLTVRVITARAFSQCDY